MSENKKVLEKNFVRDYIWELIIDKGKTPDIKQYPDTKYYTLLINNKPVGKFNFNNHGITSYAFNRKCYPDDVFKKLKEICPNMDNNVDTTEWHTHCKNYYGRKVNRGDYSIEDDKKFILRCVNYYLMELEFKEELGGII